MHSWAQGFEVIFYGGSTVESWRGTEVELTAERTRGFAAMWGRHFGVPYRATALGIAGEAEAPPLTSSLSGIMCYVGPATRQAVGIRA